MTGKMCFRDFVFLVFSVTMLNLSVNYNAGNGHQIMPITDFYVVPLEPTSQSKGIAVQDQARPSTADIIAQQSQDYVDEKLAEYQATIFYLQGN